MAFSFANIRPMAVEVGEAPIRPAADQPPVAQICIVGPKVIDIRAQRGSLQFSYAGQIQLVSEGAAYRFVLDPADDDLAISGPPNKKELPPPTKKPKAFLYFIIGAMSVATYIAIDEALESPSKP